MPRRLSLRRHHHASAPPQPDSDAQAAQRTDELLRRLPPRAWTVLGEVDPRHGIDHVLVGPGGVFAISSRKPEGTGARVRDGVLWLRRAGDTRADSPGLAINRQTLDAARALQREIRRRTGRGPAVRAVVVLWCEFPQGVVESSRIAFVHGRDLTAWLPARDCELDEAGRREVVQALRSIAEQGAGGVRRAQRLGQIAPRHRRAA